VRKQKKEMEGAKEEEMRSEWEGDATLTIVSTLNFIQSLDETIFSTIMNKRDLNTMSTWCCIFNEDDIQKLDEFSFVEKYHPF
jgi:hypothetical protein